MALAIMAISVLAPCASNAESYDPDTPRFLLSTFRNADQTKMFIATSFDGRHYEPLGGSHVHVSPDANRIRDPSIIRHNGTWFVCHTAGTSLGNANFFRVLSSPDLQNWTQIKDVSMSSIPNTNYTWAPEWFVEEDGSVHVLVSVSPWATNEHVIYEIHPLDPDDMGGGWSDPVPLYGPAFPAFVPGNDALQRVGAYDPYLLKIGGTYYLWYFNRPKSSLAYATSPALTGPYTPVVDGYLWGTESWKEGQSISDLGDGRWRFTYADARTSVLYFIESSDDWQTWSAPVLLGSPDGIWFNHGTVIGNPFAPRFSARIDADDIGGATLSVPTLKHNWYRWEQSRSLAVEDWAPVGEAFEGDGTRRAWEIEVPADAEAMFYRAKWLPFGDLGD